MTLEATIVILDNTEYSRNGDHLPTRYEAQAETIQAIISAKQQMNMENAIGIMTMGGPQVDVLVTPSNDPEVILGCLFGVKLRGEEAHFINALQIAQLALKHRKNKHMRQRIIVFVASPIVEDEKTLEKVAKGLKKNNLNVDVVNLCQSGDNQVNKLEKFVQTVSSGGQSHFLNVPSGLANLNSTLFSSPILNSFSNDDAAPARSAPSSSAQGGSQPVRNPFEEFGGIDPSEDPELAQVMKLSLEEEKRRLEQSERQQAAQAPQAEQQQSQPSGSASSEVRPAVHEAGIEVEVPVVVPQSTQANNSTGIQDESVQQLLQHEGIDDEELDEEELMAQAILASQQENPFEASTVTETDKQKKENDEKVQAGLMQDDKFVEDLMSLVKGDENDEKEEEDKKNQDKQNK